MKVKLWSHATFMTHSRDSPLILRISVYPWEDCTLAASHYRMTFMAHLTLGNWPYDAHHFQVFLVFSLKEYRFSGQPVLFLYYAFILHKGRLRWQGLFKSSPENSFPSYDIKFQPFLLSQPASTVGSHSHPPGSWADSHTLSSTRQQGKVSQQWR